MKQRLFLHVDMDAFFAAVEQRDNPEYKGKAVIIGPDPKKGQMRGVVSTCSYEAREFGIHSAMPISEAYKRCPDGIYLWGSMSNYADESREIISIFESFTNRIEQVSIDEAFLEVSDILHLYDNDPVKLAYQIQNKIKLERDLGCSVGISYKKFLSKIGSDYEKPNGLTYISPEDEIPFLDHLDISKLWGVGKKSVIKFRKLNINTVGDIKKYSYEQILTFFGKMGNHFWNLAHAIDHRDLSVKSKRKSCSKEHTFYEDVTDFEIAKKKLYQLIEEVLSLVRKKKYEVKNVHIKLRFSDFKTFNRQRVYSNQHLNTDAVFNSCLEMIDSLESNSKAIRLIGMGFDLKSENLQTDLFDSSNDKLYRLNQSKDVINQKYGKNMILGAEGLK